MRRGSVRCLLAGADRGPEGTFSEIGTWLGVNDLGLVVAVTNRRDGELAREDQTRSKGLLAVSLLGLDDPEKAVQLGQSELSGGGFGGCNYVIAHEQAAYIIQAPGANRVAVEKLAPGIHVITNLAPNDDLDPRIRFVDANLEPGQFVASAQRICRDDLIVIDGAERGTVSSSLVTVGEEIRFYHRSGDPRDGDYEELRPFDDG
jgi:uncharacterized protein with NRDE domain